jgi:hypothetical protein
MIVQNDICRKVDPTQNLNFHAEARIMLGVSNINPNGRKIARCGVGFTFGRLRAIRRLAEPKLEKRTNRCRT